VTTRETTQRVIKEEALVRVEGVSKSFGRVRALDRVSLAVGAGEFFCLLGPSGCGKSTLLRLLAGFEQPEEGRVLLDGRDVSGEPPERRPTNLMFQSYALFPHMSVAANIGYGLRWTALRRAERQQRVDAMLSLLRLDEVRDRRPDQISGGQAQRTALARALARQPRVLLLDEPLGALDRRLREDTQGELKALQRKLGTALSWSPTIRRKPWLSPTASPSSTAVASCRSGHPGTCMSAPRPGSSPAFSGT
jgi:putrescine transport system ATP-binding protein